MIALSLSNVDASGQGPLSRERMPVRLRELQMLFAEIKRLHADAQVVRGSSWLHNVDAYKRLFPPPPYTSAMKVVDEHFQYLDLWGQFLQRDGPLRQPLALIFLSCCCEQDSLEGLTRCFPYQVQGLACSIVHFYAFYEALGDF